MEISCDGVLINKTNFGFNNKFMGQSWGSIDENLLKSRLSSMVFSLQIPFLSKETLNIVMLNNMMK